MTLKVAAFCPLNHVHYHTAAEDANISEVAKSQIFVNPFNPMCLTFCNMFGTTNTTRGLP